MLGLRLVDRDDRIQENTVLLHRAETDNSGGRLLRSADDVLREVGPLLVNDGDGIRSIVHSDVRPEIQRCIDMFVVRVATLPLDRERRHAEVGNKRGGYVILGGERIRRAQSRTRAAGLKRVHQVRRLGSDVKAGYEGDSLQRLFLLEPAPDEPQNGH